MRNLITFIFSIVSTIAGMAQNADILFDDDILWVYRGGYSVSSQYVERFGEFYRFDGTYEKNGKEYHCLQFTRSFMDGSPAMNKSDKHAVEDPSPKGNIGIREDGGRVFIDRDEYLALMSDDSYWKMVGDKDYLPYPKTDDGELVLYDFTMQQGDRFPTVEGHDDIWVSKVDMLTTKDGVARKMLTLSNGCEILEGVGCLNSRGLWLFYLNPGSISYNWGVLDSYGHLGNPIYRWSEWGDISDGISAPQNASKITSSFPYDLQGRRLDSQPTNKGIYIQNGKKVVVK